jgi:hypothetical protein
MKRVVISLILSLVLILAQSSLLLAHCDTEDGPVVQAAKQALEKKNVDLALIWVKADSDAELKAAFDKAVAAKRQGKDAQEVGERFFIETVVRLHRVGEGEPYTGVKPSGTHICEVIPAADQALEKNSEEALMKMIQDKVEQGVKMLYQQVQEKKKNVSASVEAGREYVEAYVLFMHYVETVYESANLSCEKHGNKFGMNEE